MSRLTDKINEIERKLDVFTIYDFADILKEFDENSISDLFFHDIVVYLNEERTKCLTIVLLDSGTSSIQLIEENTKGTNPIFQTKNLSFEETVILIKTILRSYKLKKLQYG